MKPLANHRAIDLLGANDACTLADRMLTILGDIRERYAAGYDDAAFHAQFVFHEAVIMKCAAFRFATSALLANLKQRLVPEVIRFQQDAGMEPDTSESLLVHPILYFRVTQPGNVQSPEQADAFMDSQPHYDRAFGAYAYSCWLAMTEVGDETGGLCFFRDSADVDRHFGIKPDEKNRYNYDNYVRDRNIVDPVLRAALIPPKLHAGQAYLFDSNTLHGATKPKSRMRISFDFRLVSKREVARLDQGARTVVERFNEDINFSNAMNLLVLGDEDGAEQVCPGFRKRISGSHDAIEPRYDLSVPLQKFSWRDEYSWV